MMANRSDRRLLTLRCVRALEAVGMSTRTRRADFHQGQGSFATPISQAGYMTATRFPLSVPHPCTRAGSIYDGRAVTYDEAPILPSHSLKHLRAWVSMLAA